MIREIANIFDNLDGYNCFACGPRHPFGLKLKFQYDDVEETILTEFTPDTLFAGFPGILHGGIQATILDELAFWGIWARHHRTGFTFDLKIKYRKKCPVDRLILGRGTVGEINRRFADCDVELLDPDSGEVFTRGTVRYFLPDEDPRA